VASDVARTDRRPLEYRPNAVDEGRRVARDVQRDTAAAAWRAKASSARVLINRPSLQQTVNGTPHHGDRRGQRTLCGAGPGLTLSVIPARNATPLHPGDGGELV
jgi:hypothetical protein